MPRANSTSRWSNKSGASPDATARTSAEDRRLGNPRRGGRVSHAHAGVLVCAGVRHIRGRRARGAGPRHARFGRNVDARRGLLAAGCEVVKVGILPTPTIMMYVAETRAQGGIAITASHNPPEYNALKLFNAQGLFFNNYERAELLDLYHQSDFRRATNEEMRRVITDYESASKLHFRKVLAHVDADRIRACKFRVALDAVNGAGSLITPGFLRETLGCELEAIAVDPTQPFPREAEPKRETLGEIADLVRQCHRDIGFAQDPDR